MTAKYQFFQLNVRLSRLVIDCVGWRICPCCKRWNLEKEFHLLQRVFHGLLCLRWILGRFESLCWFGDSKLWVKSRIKLSNSIFANGSGFDRFGETLRNWWILKTLRWPPRFYFGYLLFSRFVESAGYCFHGIDYYFGYFVFGTCWFSWECECGLHNEVSKRGSVSFWRVVIFNLISWQSVRKGQIVLFPRKLWTRCRKF